MQVHLHYSFDQTGPDRGTDSAIPGVAPVLSLDRGWRETRSRSPITIPRRMRLPLIIRVYASEIRDQKPTLVVLTSRRELCRSGINDNFAWVIGLPN